MSAFPGNSTEMSRRLCRRAPLTTSRSFTCPNPYDAVERAVAESLSTDSALGDAPPTPRPHASTSSRYAPHLLLLLMLLLQHPFLLQHPLVGLLRPLRLLRPLLRLLLLTDRVAVAAQPG